ncbi:hypothetical protein Ciccas_007261 [Cichlidogyrus casuarinus]|uniref:Anoctamin dimerisation domain-containing protein n=1 Tax=Cichlidogyrus casuarinus TaxID=1844966 RepID=A0ABD2Q4Q6_9PLAT
MSQNRELTFRDGKRKIDYVLVYKRVKLEDESKDDGEKRVRRDAFLMMLSQKRIEIEVEDSEGNIIAGTGDQGVFTFKASSKKGANQKDKLCAKAIGFEKPLASVLSHYMGYSKNPWKEDLFKRIAACRERKLKGFHYYGVRFQTPPNLNRLIWFRDTEFILALDLQQKLWSLQVNHI